MGELFISALFFGVLFFLFPVFIFVDAYSDVFEGKIYFSVRLFHVLKVFGGYLQVEREGIMLHLTKKKAIYLPYSQMSDTKKKFEITKGFQLWRYHQILEIGGAGEIYGIMLSSFIQTVGAILFGILRTAHPFLSLKNNILLSSRDRIKLCVQTAFIMNGLVLVVAFSKKILEVIIQWKRKKSTLSWSKRRNNLKVS